MKKLVCLLGLAMMFNCTVVSAQEVKEKTKKGWSKKAKGSVIGGVAGAAAGAIIAGPGDRATGAIIGGAVGAGGGYLYGKSRDKKYPEQNVKYKRKVKY